MDKPVSTEMVRNQYERFPFPPLAIGALAHVRPPQADAAFARWYIYQRLPVQPLRILDAGCGTGFSTLKLAQANPEAEVVAVDLSESSLAIARARLDAAGVDPKRIRLLQADLQELSDLGQFGYIHSSGVIHHLPDPAAGLRRLRAALEPDGLAYFMVYSAHARYEIQTIQHILYSLWQKPDDWEEGLMLCRTFFRGLPVQHPLKQHYRRAIQVASEMLGPEAAQSDAFYVDTWLQRCEQLWTQPQFYELLQRTGWHPARWLDEDAWKL
ncbi:MAG: class I SAM-dependent methyltransferase, partial [Candidatus Sericytochromatia bacterium]